MKKNICVLLLMVCLVVVLISCQDKGDNLQFGALSIKVEESVPRTIEPLTANLTCASYKVTGVHASYASNQNSVYRFETTISDSATLDQLIVGQWSVFVEGFNSDGIKIMESESQTINIVANQISEKTFILSYLTSGTGTLSLTIQIPSSLSLVSSMDLTVGNGGVVSLTNSTSEGSFKYYRYEQSFDVGDYSLSLVFKDGDGRQVGFSQTDRVHIYANLTSSKTWTNPGVADVPAFSQSDTTVTDGTTLELSTATAGASVYYTLDGSTPTARNTKYVSNSPILLNRNITVKAIAVHPSLFNSDVASMTFHVKANAPQSNVPETTYQEFKSVGLTSASEGASIYYTVDGSIPSKTNGTLYSGAISIDYSQTIKAVAIKEGLDNSDIVSYSYVIKVPAPQFSSEGNMEEGETVTISCAMEGAEIRYTTDGSTPTLSSTRYTGPISIQANQVIKAIAVKLGCTNSDVATASYSVTANPVTFSVESGTYSDTQSVTLSSETENAVIYYTTDGSTPTSGSTRYTGPVAVDRNLTLKAIATKSGQNDSEVTSTTYEIKVAKPSFSVAPGSFDAVQNITLSCATSGVRYYYTVDGSTPTTSSTLYTGSIEISSTRTIKVIAVRTGCTTSDVLSGQFVINTGSGSIIIVNPTHYTLSIEMPAGWAEFVPVIKGVCANLTAVLSPTCDTATYRWYVDGEPVSRAADGNTLKLGTLEPNNVYLFEGLHIISVEATAGGKTYEESIYVSVSDNASIGTAGPNGYGVGARGPSGGYIFYDCDEDNTEDDPDGADNLTSATCGWRYLEAAPSDIYIDDPDDMDKGLRRISATEIGIVFGAIINNDGKDLYVNGTLNYSEADCTLLSIGSGKRNTELLVAAMGDSVRWDRVDTSLATHYAAKECLNYSMENNGIVFSDWFLPSKDELMMMYTNLCLNGLGSFHSSPDTTTHYWSSSEYSGYSSASAWYIVFESGSAGYLTNIGRYRVRAVRSFM